MDPQQNLASEPLNTEVSRIQSTVAVKHQYRHTITNMQPHTAAFTSIVVYACSLGEGKLNDKSSISTTLKA